MDFGMSVTTIPSMSGTMDMRDVLPGSRCSGIERIGHLANEPRGRRARERDCVTREVRLVRIARERRDICQFMLAEQRACAKKPHHAPEELRRGAHALAEATRELPLRE